MEKTSGFSLLECLIALGLFGMGLLFFLGDRMQSQHAFHVTIAHMLHLNQQANQDEQQSS